MTDDQAAPSEGDLQQGDRSAPKSFEVMDASAAEAFQAVPGLGRCLGFVISTESSPSFFELQFRLNADCAVSPGRMVAAVGRADDGRRVAILARVNDCHEVNPHEDAFSSTLKAVLPFETAYAPEGRSTVIYRVGDAEPLEEAVYGVGAALEHVGAIETMPRAGWPVFEAGRDLIVAALGTVLNPDDGLHVGQIHGSPDIDFVLARDIIQRHIFIGGGIGAGKSYTRGVLAEELQALGLPQVNIDVNNEMEQATEELGGVNLEPGADGFTLPVSALSSADVLEAVPSINPGTNMETLLRFTHESLQREVMMGRRPYFLVEDLVNKIPECAELLEMTSKATVEPTRLRTRSLTRLPFLGQPYPWRDRLTPGAIVNIKCRGMLESELRLITASVARDLQQLARSGGVPFVVFSIDEFHLVAPNNDKVVTTQVLREIARIGRHYRIGLILTTQSPSDVDRSILKRLLTRFLHAIEPDQLDALRGIFSDASDDLIRSLPKLPRGTCIVTGSFETIRHATVIDVRTRRTTHGGATPDIFSDLARAGWARKRTVSSGSAR